MSDTASKTDPAVLAALTRIGDAIFSQKNAIVGAIAKMQPVAAPPVVVTAPPAATPPTTWVPDSLTAGQAIVIPAGTYAQDSATSVPVTVQGAGMRKTILDGQKGVGAGHRLAWGKGIIHAGAEITVQDVGFVNGGGGDGNSDAEAGFYAEGFTGTAKLIRCAFDNNEDGIFTPNVSLANVDLVLDRCVFGRNGANGLNDGRSHDVYVSGRSVSITGSVFVGNSRGNTIKCRGPKLDVSNSYVARSNGRWIDAPGGTVISSSGNTYVTVPGSNVQNAFGFWDESDDTANPGQPGSFTSIGDTFYFSRYAEVIWINHPGTLVTFQNAKVFWVGAAGATPPSVWVQGPGAITGVSPFVFNESNRVDAAPPIPSDPT